MKFLIVSAPRSGTGYASMFMNELGLPCRHEAVYTIPQASTELWTDDFPGCSSWLAAPHIYSMTRDTLILHQWRDELKAAESLIRHGFFDNRMDPYASYARRFVSFPQEGRTAKACSFLRAWHRLIRNQARGRPVIEYDVEMINREWVETVCSILHYEPSEEQIVSALAVPHTINTNLREQHDLCV